MADPPEPKCPQAGDCPMYPLLAMSGTLQLWQAKYCADDFEACERYKRRARGAPVPVQLLPNGKMLDPRRKG